MTEKHFEEHPNDRKLTEFEKKLMSRIGKLRNKVKLCNIHKNIHVQLLKTQIKSDCQIKDTFIEMFPDTYKLALMESIERYGATKKKDIRRDEIIKSLNLKDDNIVKKIFKGWEPKDDTAI